MNKFEERSYAWLFIFTKSIFKIFLEPIKRGVLFLIWQLKNVPFGCGNIIECNNEAKKSRHIKWTIEENCTFKKTINKHNNCCHSV